METLTIDIRIYVIQIARYACSAEPTFTLGPMLMRDFERSGSAILKIREQRSAGKIVIQRC